jgi:hypothetical protein
MSKYQLLALTFDNSVFVAFRLWLYTLLRTMATSTRDFAGIF